jgi:drug efflux transport system permease protein
MRRFRALIRKEITHMLRDPRTLVFIFFMPVLQLVLLGFVNNSDFTNISTAIANQDNSSASRSLLDAFNSTGYFSFNYSVNSEAEVNKLIGGGNAKVGIVIPPDYGRQVQAGQSASVLVLIDGSDPTVANAALSAAQLAGQAHGTTIRSQALALKGSAAGAATPPVDVRTRVLYNPDLLSSYNLIPGLIAIILFQTGTALTALAIVRERERGTIEQLIVTPIRSWELVVAKSIPYIIVSFADTFLILLVATVLFRVPIRGSLLLLLAMTGLYLVPTLGYGLVVSTMAQTQQQAQLMIMPLMMPAFMLSGYIFPTASLPIVLQFVGDLLPTTYFIYVMRAVVIKGVGLDLIMPQTIVLGVFGLAMLALAAWRFRKSLD